ncbi:MAG: ARMT1-like domain-containing protein [Desulfoprunum sp.]|uniref:damage-control phosphatase ARMT1 family protein n=1 Tax=Desulfoprunum sp. TaxID=2020866 RepID=UPI0006912147
MKTHPDCLPCYRRQALQVAKICSDRAADHQAVVAAIDILLPDIDLQQTPPANAIRIYERIAAVTGCPDPYRHIKKRNNVEARRLLPLIREDVRRSAVPLAAAVRFAIAGNSIDYGAFAAIDADGAISRCRSAVLAVDHLHLLLDRIGRLQNGSRVLYLADNCGEIVYDQLVLECLQERGLDLTVAVRGGPIINDASLEDALECGLDRYGRVIGSGVACPGTSLAHCSDELLGHFHRADLVISKGQGNFETLSEVDRDIFFLLMVKCRVAARHLAGLTGIDQRLLPGEGEMVVYYSPQHQP